MQRLHSEEIELEVPGASTSYENNNPEDSDAVKFTKNGKTGDSEVTLGEGQADLASAQDEQARRLNLTLYVTIAVVILFNLPFGITALVLALLARRDNKRGMLDSCKKKETAALWLSLLGITITVIIVVVVVSVYVAQIQQGHRTLS